MQTTTNTAENIDNPELQRKMLNFDELDFQEWLQSDNVIKIGPNTYIEQLGQWKKEYTEDSIREFYINEYMEC